MYNQIMETKHDSNAERIIKRPRWAWIIFILYVIPALLLAYATVCVATKNQVQFFELVKIILPILFGLAGPILLIFARKEALIFFVGLFALRLLYLITGYFMGPKTFDSTSLGAFVIDFVVLNYVWTLTKHKLLK